MNGIAPEISHLAFQVELLGEFPGNARRGNVPALMRSLEAHGQYRPIVVNGRTSQVLAGWHVLQAAVRLGWDVIAAYVIDAEPELATRINLVDNRAADLATYDTAGLVELLEALPDLERVGYDARALAALRHDLGESLAEANLAPIRVGIGGVYLTVEREAFDRWGAELIKVGRNRVGVEAELRRRLGL